MDITDFMSRKEPERGRLPKLPQNVRLDIETIIKNDDAAERTVDSMKETIKKSCPAHFSNYDNEHIREYIEEMLDKYPDAPKKEHEEDLRYENGEYKLGQALKDIYNMNPSVRELIDVGPDKWKHSDLCNFVEEIINFKLKKEETLKILDNINCKMWESYSTEYRDAFIEEKYRMLESKALIQNCDEYGVPVEFTGLYELDIDKNGNVKNIAFFYDKIADKIRNDLSTVFFKNIVYAYEDGYYREGEESIKTEIARTVRGIKAANKRCKASVRGADGEILFYLKYHDPYKEWPFNNIPGMVPVNNGIIKMDFETGTAELVPHSPEYKFNYIIPVDFDQNADKEPIERILKDYVEPEDVEELYQIPAQAILQASGHAPFKKCYLLQGRPDGGKSTYLELLYRCFGKQNKSDVSLEDLNQSVHRYKSAGLIGKLFNIHDDLQSFPMKDTGFLKKLTGAYSHDVEIKGVQPFEAKLTAVHVFACNDPPKIDNPEVKKDEAFWGRWEYVRFPNHFEKDTTFYERTFTPENLSGFLLSVVEAALQIGKENRLLKASNYANVRDTWAKCSEPVYQFITENMDRAEQTIYFEKEEMLKLIREWGYEKQLEADDLPSSRERLTKILEICGIGTAKPVSAKTGTQVPAYAFPYRWREDSKWQTKINRIELKKEQAKFE